MSPHLTNRPVSVVSDLFLDLKLYHVPQKIRDSLAKKFSGLSLQFLDERSAEKIDFESVEVYWGNRFTQASFDRMPNLKWIHFGSAGTDRLRQVNFADKKILVSNSVGVMDNSVAVSALAFILALARGFHACWDLRNQGNLSRSSFDSNFDRTTDLDGKHCLVFGMGNVGRKLAQLCEGVGMKVSGVNRGTGPKDVKHLLSEADFVVNCLPLTDETEGYFSADRLSLMPPSAYFVNVGRGKTVVESDLISLLKDRRIAGAGLDVFAEEPLSNDSALWSLPNVILTPHVAGLHSGYWEKQGRLFEENMRRYLLGDRLINQVSHDSNK